MCISGNNWDKQIVTVSQRGKSRCSKTSPVCWVCSWIEEPNMSSGGQRCSHLNDLNGRFWRIANSCLAPLKAQNSVFSCPRNMKTHAR